MDLLHRIVSKAELSEIYREFTRGRSGALFIGILHGKRLVFLAPANRFHSVADPSMGCTSYIWIFCPHHQDALQINGRIDGTVVRTRLSRDLGCG